VTVATRERIKALARDCGYVPNVLAAALASSKKGKPVKAVRVALVTDSPHYNVGHEAVNYRRPLAELGYEMDWFDLSNHRLSPISLRNQLYHRGYDGVIFGETRIFRPDLFSPNWDSFSVVCAGRSHYRPPFDVIRANTFESVSQAWRSIRACGYRRIGFALCRHEPRMLDDYEREGALAAFQTELLAHETAIPPYLGRHDDAAALKKWFHRVKPDALAGFNSLHYFLLKELGWRIPGDLGYANLQYDGRVEIAAVDVGGWQIPRLCAEHINQLIRHRHLGRPADPRDILTSIKWISGKSLLMTASEQIPTSAL
jgi:DNA-binding LacI/PurR family transcriptional regulator